MSNKFDELAKGFAQSVTRRAALKKFGVGLVGLALAALGLANKAEAGPKKHYACKCRQSNYGCDPLDETCLGTCWVKCTGGGG